MVQEWAHLKWGLYGEKSTDPDTNWYPLNRRLQPTRYLIVTTYVFQILHVNTTAVEFHSERLSFSSFALVNFTKQSVYTAAQLRSTQYQIKLGIVIYL